MSRARAFEFLGYRFSARPRHVRRESLEKLEVTIREKTRRNRGRSRKVVVDDLDRTLRGWFAYFKHAHPAVFGALDAMVRRRLRAYLRRQERRGPGLGICRNDPMRWPNAFFANAFFANAGSFALHTARHSARQSR